MIDRLLQELGLSNYESRIYQVLIGLGDSTAGRIAEDAKLNRRNVYDALNRLVGKGLVSSSTRNGKKRYCAVHPKRITGLYEEKLDIAKGLLPELLNKYNHSEKKRDVQVFEGDGGMKTIFSMLFEDEKPVHIIGATGESMNRMPVFFAQLFKKGKRKNVTVNQLWNHGAKNKKLFSSMLHSEDRILPKNLRTSTQIFLSGDKSVILVWSTVPLAILIIDKEIAAGFQRYFHFLWGISK